MSFCWAENAESSSNLQIKAFNNVFLENEENYNPDPEYGGRQYCLIEIKEEKEKQYASGWKIFPDILKKVLAGNAKMQCFKIYQDDMYQGTISVKLVNAVGDYDPLVTTSGSLVVVGEGKDVRLLLSERILSEFFGLKKKSAEAADAIQYIFKKVHSGKSCANYLLKDGSILRYSQFFNEKNQLRCYCFVQGNNTKKNNIIRKQAKNFFKSIFLGPAFF